MPFNFGYYLADVDVPELDAFISEMNALCERHGIGFEWKSGWGDDSSKVVVVPVDRNDVSFLFADLEDYAGGIPFLDAAKARAKQSYEERHRREQAASAQKAAAAQAAHEERLRREGVALSDGVYRLVKTATTETT